MGWDPGPYKKEKMTRASALPWFFFLVMTGCFTLLSPCLLHQDELMPLSCEPKKTLPSLCCCGCVFYLNKQSKNTVSVWKGQQNQRKKKLGILGKRVDLAARILKQLHRWFFPQLQSLPLSGMFFSFLTHNLYFCQQPWGPAPILCSRT